MASLHAAMFPYPGQSHINPMTQLMRKLLNKGFFITFINTEFNQQRILENGSSNDLLSLPNLEFRVIPDGLPADHGRVNQNVMDLVVAIDVLGKSMEILMRDIVGKASVPVSCIIADSLTLWMQDVAHAINLPFAVLWTTPVHANLAACAQSLLMAEGIVPLRGKEQLSSVVTCIPGLPPFPLSDLISFFLTENASDYYFQWYLRNFAERPKKSTWNLGNNIYELEKEAADAFRHQVQSFFTIGPLLPPEFFSENLTTDSGRMNLMPEEKSCKEWLDKQKPASVVYISFGSVVIMNPKEVEELAMGIEASGQAFLWVQKTQVGAGAGWDVEGFKERTRDRGMVVSWAPQLQVLSHRSVGGFVSHCGWNSVMEGMSAGVPIVVMSGGFAEQNMNARYVVHEWKAGIEIEREADKEGAEGDVKYGRVGVETAIRALFRGGGKPGDDLRRGAGLVRELARSALQEGGSSHRDLDLFVEAVRLKAQANKI